MAIEFTQTTPMSEDDFEGVDLEQDEPGQDNFKADLLDEDEDLGEESDDFEDDADDDDLDDGEEEDDGFFDADDDDPKPKAKPKAKAKTPAVDPAVASMAATQAAMVELLKNSQTKPEAKPDANANEADDPVKWQADLMKSLTVTVPDNYLEAIRSGEPAQASQALNTLMAYQAQKIVEGLTKRFDDKLETRLTAQKTEAETQHTQQSQQTQLSQALEDDFSTRYGELQSLSDNPDLKQYLSNAVRNVAADPATKSMKSVTEFSDAVAKETRAMLKPLFKAAGMQFTRANLATLTGKAKKRNTPPKALGGKATGRKRKPSADGDLDVMFDVSDL